MTSLNSKFSIKYKKLLLVLVPLSGLALTVLVLWTKGTSFESLLQLVPVIVLTFIVTKRILLLKEVYYDSSDLFIKEKNQEEIIPLEAISSVELKSIGGQWDIRFKPGFGKRKQLVFIPSMRYPLSFKMTDKMVVVFRTAIEKAKKEEDTFTGITSSHS